MVYVVVNHIVTKEFHPLLIFSTVHMTAPFTNKFRSNIFSIDICPCIIPVIVKESLCSEIFVKPSLSVNRRAVIVRRINNLTCTMFRLYGIFSCTSEISAPPCTNIWRIVTSVGHTPVITCHSTAHRLFNTFNKDKCIRVYIKNGISTFCCSISPVVFIC